MVPGVDPVVGRCPIARTLPLEFTAVRRVAPPGQAEDVIQAQAGPGVIEVSGGFGAGSRGWRLTAQAAKYRRVITLYVTARRRQPHPERGLEDYAYRARIGPVPSGRYEVRIIHRYVNGVPGQPAEQLVRHAAAVTVPEQGPAAPTEAGGPPRPGRTHPAPTPT